MRLRELHLPPPEPVVQAAKPRTIAVINAAAENFFINLCQKLVWFKISYAKLNIFFAFPTRSGPFFVFFVGGGKNRPETGSETAAENLNDVL